MLHVLTELWFLWKVFNDDDEDSSSKARYEMKTQMLLVRESSPLQLSAAKKMKTEELAKENEENENASSFEVAEKENVSCTKPIKDVDSGLKLDEEELQGNMENEAETPIYVGLKLICPSLKLDLFRLQI